LTYLAATGCDLTYDMKLRHNSAFVRFWLASSVSDFGTYLTTVALSVLLLLTLYGTALDKGRVNAARWAPYLLMRLLGPSSPTNRPPIGFAYVGSLCSGCPRG